jgi:hypothetical protein
MLVTGVESFYNAPCPNYLSFNIALFITCIHAVLAIIYTHINEIAPRHCRAKHTTVIFVMSAVGGLFVMWAGLILTTAAASWPMAFRLPWPPRASKTTGDGCTASAP